MSCARRVVDPLGVVVEHALLVEREQVAAIMRDRLRLAVGSYGQLLDGLAELVWLQNQDSGELEPAGRRLMSEVRETMWALEPAELDDIGLVGALTDLARRHEMAGLLVMVDLDGEQPPAMDRRCSLALLRAGEEALDNAAAHAAAHRVAVHLDFGPAEASIQISDDGVGFDVETMPPWLRRRPSPTRRSGRRPRSRRWRSSRSIP